MDITNPCIGGLVPEKAENLQNLPPMKTLCRRVKVKPT